jgi:hypothetical protein
MNEPEIGPEFPVAQGAETQQAEHETRPQSSTIGIGSSIGVGCLIVVVLFIIIAFAIRWIFGSW